MQAAGGRAAGDATPTGSSSAERVHLLGQLAVNTFRDQQSVDIVIEDVALAAAGAAPLSGGVAGATAVAGGVAPEPS
jgi:hypothetical protein